MVTKTEIPDNSILKKYENTFDYIDSYQSSFVDEEQSIDLIKIGKLFFTSGPKWVGVLFAIRNKVVGLLGLKTPGKTADRQQQLDSFKFEPGEQLGLFKLFDKTENEFILGEDDKHLNFRVSLLLNMQHNQPARKTLTITTTVKYNNIFGQLYFLPVRPFHKRIVATMLKRVLIQIETEKQRPANIM